MEKLKIIRKDHLISIFLILLILMVYVPVSGRALYDPAKITESIPPDKSDEPCVEVGFHDAGKMGFTINNLGQIGDGFTSSGHPSCIYPYPGDNEYLFGGTIWIGAVIGEDTLVSVGVDGWQFTREMWPDSCPDGHIISDSAISHQDYTAMFTDTLTDPSYVAEDYFDGRPHIPLNIHVTQRSFAWDYPIADDFVLLDYQIENIGDQELSQVYLGFYVDGDVLKSGGFDGFDDDICGFKTAVNSIQGCGFMDTVNLTWIADNDGKHENSDNECTLPAVTGMRLIRTPSDSLKFSFNWWMSNGNPSLDWGPRMVGTTEDPFRDFGGFLGTPEGDKNKYYIMRHEEFDYDQLFAAVYQTPNGWLPPHPLSLCVDFANGYDTRYLLSFGPFNIEPGEILPVTVAYVAGGNFHTQPCDAFEYIFDPFYPEAYYAQLNFDDIASNAVWADWVYDNPGVDTDGDGYFGKYRICGLDTLYYQGDGVPDFNPLFICGDIMPNGAINLMDVLFLLKYYYQGGEEPPSFNMADVNDSDNLDLLDVTYLINYLYLGGPKPNCD